MELKTVTVAERDLVALAKIVHAAHDTRIRWEDCNCPSCRKIFFMIRDFRQPPPTAFYLLELS